MAGGVARTINTEPFEKFDAWLQREDTGQMTLWPGVIELSQKFYDTLREHAVPLDPEALKALKHSALALDIIHGLPIASVAYSDPHGSPMTISRISSARNTGKSGRRCGPSLWRYARCWSSIPTPGSRACAAA